MGQPAIADQTAEFMELLQKAGELGRRRQGNAIAKATGQDFSVVDAATVARAYARAGMWRMPRPPSTGRRCRWKSLRPMWGRQRRISPLPSG